VLDDYVCEVGMTENKDRGHLNEKKHDLRKNNFFDTKNNKDHNHNHFNNDDKKFSESYPSKFSTDRQKAQQIVIYEVRRLHMALKKLEKNKMVLEKKVTYDSAVNADLKIAIQNLEKRSTDREHGISALRELLHCKLGDKGLNELTVSMEEMNVGGNILFKEMSQRF
jgi:hypothetical protein